MKYIFILCTVFFAIVSCKELDLSPKDAVNDEVYWKTADDFKKGANLLYYSLDVFPAYDASGYWDVQSDIAFNSNNTISNGTYQPVEKSTEWSDPYVYIRRCNNIIEKAMNSGLNDQIKQYVGEAKFFRAYNYWKLLRLYGGVPLITKVLDINSPELYSKRATKKEIVDFILQDLKDASDNLLLRSELSSEDIGRVTKGAAQSLMARVALFEGTWNKYHQTGEYTEYLDMAVSASTAVIVSGEYDLYAEKGEDSYRYLFIEEGDDSKECILDRRYQKDIEGQLFPALIQRIGYVATKKLADMYLCIDGLPIDKSRLFQGYASLASEFVDRDPRMSMTIMKPGTVAPYPNYADGVGMWPFYPQRIPNTGYITYKYISENHYANSQGESPNFSFDNHIIRYAEVLLIYAEALFEKNGKIDDEDLNKSINVLRHRVGMPDLTNEFIAENGLDMLNEIRRERTIELAFENFRYDDLRRWKTAEIELPKDILGIKIKDTEWSEPIIIDGADKNIYATSDWQKKVNEEGFIIVESHTDRHFDPQKHYWRPIPTKEILLNPNLEQNPNW